MYNGTICNVLEQIVENGIQDSMLNHSEKDALITTLIQPSILVGGANKRIMEAERTDKKSLPGGRTTLLLYFPVVAASTRDKSYIP
jgi:hypothetical protein